MDIAINLKKLRLEENKTQQDIADFLQIARTTYNHYETLEKIIPLERLNKLCNFYNVSFDYFFGLIEFKNDNKEPKKINYNILSIRLKEFRKSKKLTQVKLAQFLNTTQSVIADYERNKKVIAPIFLYALCTKYKISADYLLGRVDEPIYITQK